MVRAFAVGSIGSGKDLFFALCERLRSTRWQQRHVFSFNAMQRIGCCGLH